MNDVCIIEINGTQYYCPADLVNYLKVIDGYLVNTGSTQITLYATLREYNNNYSGYPRITAQTNYKAYITQSYNSSPSTLSVNSFNVVSRSFSDSMLISIIGVLALVLIFFKR